MRRNLPWGHFICFLKRVLLKKGLEINVHQLVLDAAEKLAGRVGLFVLAQGSMARMEDKIAETTGKKVLSSPERGVLNVKEVLASL